MDKIKLTIQITTLLLGGAGLALGIASHQLEKKKLKTMKDDLDDLRAEIEALKRACGM